jgi:hypothetical protein
VEGYVLESHQLIFFCSKTQSKTLTQIIRIFDRYKYFSRVTKIPISGEISEISSEKKTLEYADIQNAEVHTYQWGSHGNQFQWDFIEIHWISVISVDTEILRFGQNISVISAIHMVSKNIQIVFQKYKYFDEF